MRFKYLLPTNLLKKIPKKQRFFVEIALGILLVIAIPLVIFSLRKPETTEAAWFNEDWGYRKAVNIATHTAAENNVYINLTGANDLDTSDTTRFQGDCGDLRFTKQNGELLPYYIASGCGTSDTVVHVFFDTFPVGAQTIYYYYGNPSASNGFETADFSTEASNYTFGTAGTEEKSVGPVAYWKFDEGYGQTVNDSIATASGTLTCTGANCEKPTWAPEDQCVSGKCLKFDGSDDFISVANSATIQNTVWSFSAWINWKGANLEGYGGLVERINGSTTSNSNRILIADSTSKIWIQGDSVTQLISNTSLNKNQWYFITVTQSGGTPTLYINGVLDKTGSAGTFTPGTSPLYIGRGSVESTTYYFNGYLDDIKIYNYARTAAQIKTDYASRGSVKGTSSSIGGKDQLNQALSNGLVGYWKMDEATWSGTLSNEVIDSSGNSSHGTTNGTTGGKAYPTGGKFGNGGYFDGVDDYVQIPNMSFNNNQSVGFWFKPTSTINSSSGRKDLWYGGENYLLINYGAADGELSWIVSVDSSNRQVKSTTTSWTAGTWYHIWATYDGVNLKLYINGALENTTSYSGTVTNNNYTPQWGSSAGSNAFAGVIDDLRIYNRALSPQEVEDLYSWAPPPIAYYDFEEGQGGTVYDKGSTSSATLNNGTWNGTGASHYDEGKYGWAGGLNGSDDYVDLGSSTILQPQNVSWELWFNPSALSLADSLGREQDFFSNQGGASNTGWSFYNQNGTNNLSFTAKINGSFRTLTFISSAQRGTWYHLAATYDGATLVIYLNGVRVNSTSPGGTIDYSTSPSIKLGRLGSGSYNTSGLVDEVRIYNYARTQKQIIEDMNAGHPAGGSPVGSAVGYWKFDEGQGTRAGNSGSGGTTLNGILASSPNTPGWSTSGKFGKALSFDGTNDTASIPDNSALDFGTGDFTVSFWLKVTSTLTTNTEYGIVNKNSTFQGSAGWGIEVSSWGGSASTYQIILYNTGQSTWGNTSSVSPPGSMSANQWYHVVGTRQGTTMKTYVNGLLAGSKTHSDVGLTVNNSQAITIADHSWGPNLPGLIDEVKVYNYALTADEVKLDYNQGASLVLGAFGTSADGKTASNSASTLYCVPGDTSTCNPPVAEWNFEEGKDNTCTGGVNDVCDSSGNGNDGAWNGTGTTHWKPGKIGGGGKFNGSSDRVTLSSSSSIPIGNSTYTISAWIKPNSYGTYGIVGWGTWSTANAVNAFRLTSTGLVNYWWGNDLTVTVSGLTDGKWHHVVALFDGTNRRIYVDSRQVGQDTPSNHNATFNDFNIGRTNSGEYFPGLIDQVRIFDYARTPAQVALDYNRGAPVGWWKFDECQGTTLHDSSGNGNTGTWNGTGGGTQTAVGTCTTSGTAWGNGATGKYNASLNFDGTDDHVDAILSSAVTSNTTISAWVYITQDNGTWRTIAGSGDNDYAYLRFADTNCVAFTYTNDNTCATIAKNAWHHIVGVYDGTNKTLYIDGILKNQKAVSGHSFSNIGIGAQYGGAASTWFNGQIDDVRIYNYALTPLQVKGLYNNGSVNFGPSSGAP